uniref:UCH37-like C-terminal domain-containing protein n=1 Tax=Octopus bimaculoides TaxID=37653 RepID=A0A0L8G8D1_OCTBM
MMMAAVVVVMMMTKMIVMMMTAVLVVVMMMMGVVDENADWLDVVRPVIEKRIQKYHNDEIHFNLMAIVSDRKMLYERKMKDFESSAMETDDIGSEISRLQMLIQEEEQKMARYKIENIRRKHNYLPFIVELLKCLAKEEKLVPLVEKAKEKAAKKKEVKA